MSKSSAKKIKAEKNKIRKHFELKLPNDGKRLDSECSYYLLLCMGAAVSIRSQQMRAMSLVWALSEQLKEDKPKLPVIGGGAAGLTFAAAAAKLGARVHLFERHKLMHLQIGSWHRPLHPEIYAWPEATAYRPVSHLPALGWTTGTAHEVATEVVDKFRVLAANQKNLEFHEEERAILTASGELLAKSLGRPTRFQIIVLAVGYGVEETPTNLPLNSYWRADALDQSFLGDDPSSLDNKKPTVVICGSGDGGLIEILRSCVLETDQGPFLDKMLALTLRDKKLRRAIGDIEKRTKNITQGYLKLKDYESLRAIDGFLYEKRRKDIKVRWLYTSATPFEGYSLPINRFLVSRLMMNESKFHLKTCPNATNVQLSRIEGGRYRVRYDQQNSKKTILCQQAVFRWGPKRHEDMKREQQKYPDLLRSVSRVFQDPSRKTLKRLNQWLVMSKSDKNKHKNCNQPREWNLPELDKPAPVRHPTLMAEFIEAFDSPDPKQPGAPFVYRIRIWLRPHLSDDLPGISKDLRVRYDLHASERNRPVFRIGIGHNHHEQWINTRNDYEIRVRTSDGFEWPVGSVIEALRIRYMLEKQEDKTYGADKRARALLKVMGKKKNGVFGETRVRHSFQKAINELDKQSRKLKA